MAAVPTPQSALGRYRVVVGASLLIRCVALVLWRNTPFPSDGRDYVEMAHQLVSGNAFPYWPPGLPLYLAPFVALHASDAVLRASMLLFWGIACWALYRLMQALEVQQIAWLVLGVFSLLPDAIETSVAPLTQMPVAALLLLGISAAVRAVRWKRPAEFAWMGLSLGAATLVRPSAGVLLILLPLACAWWTRHVVSVLAGMALGLVLLGCWMVRAHETTGQWVVNTSNGYNIYYGNNPWTPKYRTWYFGSHAKPDTEEIERFPGYKQVMERVLSMPRLEQPKEFQRLAMDEIRQHPLLFLERTANRIRCFFGFDIFTSAQLRGVRWGGLPLFPPVLLMEALVYLALTGTSLFWIAQAPGALWRQPASWILLGGIVLYAAPYWATMSHPTYHLPVLLPMAVLGASAWHLSGVVKPVRTRTWIVLAVLLAIQAEWVWQMTTGA